MAAKSLLSLTQARCLKLVEAINSPLNREDKPLTHQVVATPHWIQKQEDKMVALEKGGGGQLAIQRASGLIFCTEENGPSFVV